jgi:hypothetical protein
MSKFTRRELAAALSTSAVLLARPQAPPPPANPASSPASHAAANPPSNPPSNADDELKALRAQLRDNAERLNNFTLPMSVEPATTFKP